jgi:lipopolysaccharide/colanic/teichoic acid biosynthesis glycosyltransferase
MHELSRQALCAHGARDDAPRGNRGRLTVLRTDPTPPVEERATATGEGLSAPLLTPGPPSSAEVALGWPNNVGVSLAVPEINGVAGVPAPMPDVLGGAALPHAPEWTVRLDRAAKRALDVAVSVAVLLILVPVIVVLAIAIKLDSRGPAFFRCERRGYWGARLMMLKFRKMRDGVTGAPLTLAHDNRFTRIGAWLARRKLDELPQLWHVLRGEMSLVGPRPESARFVDCFPHEYERILRTRPGIVGLSQLVFFDEGQMLDVCDPVRHYVDEILPKKVEMDLWYVERRTVWLDLRILGWTALALTFRRPVAVDCATSRIGWKKGDDA